MGDGEKAREGSNEREALDEMLVAAAVLCMQLGETEAADHVLEALRRLHYRAANDAK
jgi:hypothetical protein